MLVAVLDSAMARSIQHSVTVITGASSGIGRATARELARRGSALVLASRRPLLLSDVAGECHELGAQAIAVPLDVADEHGLTALAHKAVETFGHLDVWFNNAGVGVVGRLEDIPAEAVHRGVEINLLSCVYGARACLPHFKHQGHGVLINHACLLAEDTPEHMSLYVMAKWGVRGFGAALRQEVASSGIHVCTLLSGPVDSSFYEHAANFTHRTLEAPVRRLDPEAVAQAVVRCIEHPKPEVTVRGGAGTPGLSRHRVEPDPGALFEPAPDGRLAPIA
ncbi:MAG TPA: SDR family NAD(P)-dependent oxidoreductase [Chloroflexota bacterium]|nr:SDR family NAD(P)-dependent oxidoreductase [Chloroflexota bacterium]